MDTTQGVAVGGDEPCPSKSTSHAALHTSWCAVWYWTSPGFLSPTGEGFVRKLQEEAEKLFREYIATPQLLVPTDAELRSFQTAINCHMQPAAGRGQCA